MVDRLRPRTRKPEWHGPLRALTLVALGSQVLAACEAGPPAAGGGSGPLEAASVVDPAALPRMEPVEAFRLGGPDVPEPEVFVREPALAVGDDESLFVLARSANEVRRFGPDGSFLGTMAGAGEGPGELQNALRLGLVGDTVWVRNLSPPFVSFYTVGGDFLRTERYDDAAISRTGVPEGPEDMLSGGAWFTVGVVPFGGPSGPRDVPLLVVEPGSGSRDTLDFVVDPPVPSIQGFWLTAALRGPPLYDVVPGGGAVVIAHWGPVRARGGARTLEELPEGAVVLRRFDPGAALAGADSVRFPAVPLPPGVGDSIVNAAADTLRARAARLAEAGIPDPPELPDDLEGTVRAALDLPEVLPPVQGLLAGVDGTLWLARPLDPIRREWVVLDGGRPLFRVDLPKGVTLRAASRGALWATRTDELGVPHVIAYRLVEAGGG